MRERRDLWMGVRGFLFVCLFGDLVALVFIRFWDAELASELVNVIFTGRPRGRLSSGGSARQVR